MHVANDYKNKPLKIFNSLFCLATRGSACSSSYSQVSPNLNFRIPFPTFFTFIRAFCRVFNIIFLPQLSFQFSLSNLFYHLLNFYNMAMFRRTTSIFNRLINAKLASTNCNSFASPTVATSKITYEFLHFLSNFIFN